MATPAAEAAIAGLAGSWRDAGMMSGDTLLLHSNIRRTLRHAIRIWGRVEPADILESFLTALGPRGTLILPLFNFAFTTGATFDIRVSPSEMGVLTEVGRRYPGAVRTGHPIYSFAVIGKAAESCLGLANSSGYGSDSPFGLLRALDGKIGVLDLPDQNSMTFYHHVEEMLGVDYRYHKRFRGPYVDHDGVQTMREYGIFVRNMNRGVQTQVDPMGELLWQQGLYRGSRPNQGSGLRTIRARAMFDAVAAVIRAGRARGLLYTEDGTT
jgi:aminoglycoside 3-N-acetyltransferase